LAIALTDAKTARRAGCALSAKVECVRCGSNDAFKRSRTLSGACLVCGHRARENKVLDPALGFEPTSASVLPG
jgi:hypothetical protein